MVRLTHDDDKEILRYSGYKGGELTDRICDELETAKRLANETANIVSTWKRFELTYTKEGIAMAPDGPILIGESIKKHLNGCRFAVLFCVTLGQNFDRELAKLMVKEPSLGVLFHAAGVALIEKAADELQLQIDNELGGGLHTGVRFSPGYGDLPLEIQKDFIKVLETEKRCGVRLNSGCLMYPEKSVTAIAGIME